MFDFSGYATKNDLRCSDGRIIRHGAFRDCDGIVVPLVWQHLHDKPSNILGHAELENRDDGVYAYCSFNNTVHGQEAKTLVSHGDITNMSIYANKLKQNGNNVIHGMIREVSLVLSGANPGAVIDNLNFAHSDGSYEASEEEAIIYANDGIFIHADSDDDEIDEEEYEEEPEEGEEELEEGEEYKEEPEEEPEEELEEEPEEEEDNMAHADDIDDMTVEDVFDTLTDEQKEVAYFLIGQAVNGETEDLDEMEQSGIAHADYDDDRTVADVFDTFTDEQKEAVYVLIGAALEMQESGELEQSDFYEDDGYFDYEGDYAMKHNVFDQDEYYDDDVLSHSELEEIFDDAKRIGSLKESFLQHGIEQIDYLYPEAQMVSDMPDLITRDLSWVDQVWAATKKTPFSRIKSIAANLTEDEARAKGYIKGTEKVEEQFQLLSRVTDPQTVYKKQSIDRDDMIDIIDIDIVSWLKSEMRLMLDEELARAILVGDNRSTMSQDKIKEDRIRPIYQDADLYTIHYNVTYPDNPNTSQKAAALIEAALRARKDYKGSGNPTFYGSTEVINDMLLATDTIGRRLYPTMDELASALRVKEVVEVPVMENVTRTDSDSHEHELLGLIVNLADYVVGSDKGGAINLFDDFDIDYNKQKYLIETRCSGAMVKPYGAIALEKSPSVNF